MPSVSRGLARIWVALIALIELIVLSAAARVVWLWAHENPFDQFDAGYESIWSRLTPFAATVVIVAAAGLASWLVVRWVARGFSG
jgi:hypothetical protein